MVQLKKLYSQNLQWQLFSINSNTPVVKGGLLY